MNIIKLPVGGLVDPSEADKVEEVTVTSDILSWPLARIEKEVIYYNMTRFRGNTDKASKAMGISRTGLYKKIDRHGLKHLLTKVSER